MKLFGLEFSSEEISVISLVVAIGFGLYNLWYARKRFKYITKTLPKRQELDERKLRIHQRLAGQIEQLESNVRSVQKIIALNSVYSKPSVAIPENHSCEIVYNEIRFELLQLAAPLCGYLTKDMRGHSDHAIPLGEEKQRKRLADCADDIWELFLTYKTSISDHPDYSARFRFPSEEWAEETRNTAEPLLATLSEIKSGLSF